MNAQFLPLLLIAALAVLLIMNTRRQKRAIADAQRLQKSLVNGDRVVTTSGLHATVVGSAEDTTIELEIAPGVRTKWLRAAIREKIITADPGSAPLAAPADGSARTDDS
ncbi:MAG: preprotein translocase subunit YajC [Pseudonocardiaceae bacterium]